MVGKEEKPEEKEYIPPQELYKKEKERAKKLLEMLIS